MVESPTRWNPNCSNADTAVGIKDSGGNELDGNVKINVEFELLDAPASRATKKNYGNYAEEHSNLTSKPSRAVFWRRMRRRVSAPN